MNYLITFAGKGSRFIKNGIKPPKPLIKVFGKELLLWSLSSFKFNSKDKLFLVSYLGHEIRQKLEKKLLCIFPTLKIFWLELEDIPNGQLLTAFEAVKYFKIDGPLIIHNCDSFFDFNNEEVENLLDEKIFGVIPYFKSSGDHWSFAKLSSIDKAEVLEVREKLKISNNCSVGTYIFYSTKEFKDLTDSYLKNQSELLNSEFFIAPLYQFAIEKNLKVKACIAKNVKIFGTINELLKTFKISFEELLGENSWDAHQRQTIIVDIDNTICENVSKGDYSKAKPIAEVCKALRKADSQGVYIILFTSRNMRTFKGSIGLINKITAPILLKWLSKNKIPFDEIYYGKPWGNSVSYIDDKSKSIEDLIKSF